MEISLLPVSAGIELYRRQATRFYEAYMIEEPAVVEFIRAHHPRLRKWVEEKCPYIMVTPADIQLAMADWYYFESWMHLAEWVAAVTQKDSPVFLFELAVEAIFTGDAAKLEGLLREEPGLVRARSMRRHHATLLHYVGANGVEYYRGQYPANAVEILKLLLEAGAEVNAEADMYGGRATALGLIATSIHPTRAGVMNPLLEALLNAGATIDHPGAAGNGHYAVNGCLANGRPEAADFLARRGARLDLEGAAGVGRLDVVRSYFNDDGSLKAPATGTQLARGFAWACEYGQTAVVGFLLDKGADPNEQVNGMNGLHWAVIGGHLDTIKLLIDRRAPLESVNVYGGTALGTAFWATANQDEVYRWPGFTDDIMVIEVLLDAGAKIGPGTLDWLDRQDIPAAKKAAIGDLLESYGAES
jgi:hypothetical protein